MTGYLVYHCFDNDEPWEDHIHSEGVVSIYLSYNKAKEYIENLECPKDSIEGFYNDDWKDDITYGKDFVRAFYEVTKFGYIPHEWYEIREMEIVE